MKTIIITFFFLLSLNSENLAQSRLRPSDIKNIEKNYQDCLDKGSFMLGCSNNYYNLMDSCLNVAYRQLIEKLDTSSKEALKKEEIIWLKTRDEKFKLIERTNKAEGQDGEMVRTDKKADFVKERVLVLIKRLTSNRNLVPHNRKPPNR